MQARILGSDHPDTPTTRQNVADFTERSGNRVRALQLLRASCCLTRNASSAETIRRPAKHEVQFDD